MRKLGFMISSFLASNGAALHAPLPRLARSCKRMPSQEGTSSMTSRTFVLKMAQAKARHSVECGWSAQRPTKGLLRLIDSCITQLKAQGPSRTCNESKEEEEEGFLVAECPRMGQDFLRYISISPQMACRRLLGAGHL